MFITLVLVAALSQPQSSAAWMLDANRARQASVAVFQYVQENNDQLPADMASLVPLLTGDLSNNSPQERAAVYRRSFFSSQDQNSPIPDDATPQWVAEHSSLTYLGTSGVSMSDLAGWNDLAILHVKFDKAIPTDPTPANPEGRIYTVSFIDGHTEAMNRADAERVVGESIAVYDALKQGKPLPQSHQTVLDLRSISHAIHAYAKAHEDALPPDLGATLSFIPADKRHAAPASRAAVFLSVESQKQTHIPDDPTPDWVNEHTSYLYLGDAETKLERVEDPDNTILVYGRLDAPIDVGLRGRRGVDVKSFPLLSAAGAGQLQPEKFTRWIIDVSRRVIESARTGAPLPEHLNALRDCRLITDACLAYAKAHNDILPPDLAATLDYLKLDDHATARDKALVYLSPRAERSTGIPEQVTPEWITRYSDYTYLGAGIDRKLALEAGIQLFLHGPLDEAWDIMDRGTDVHASVIGGFWGKAFLMDADSVRQHAADAKQSLDAIRAGTNR